MPSATSESRSEVLEVARLLERFSQSAVDAEPVQLAAAWRALERRVLACVRELENEPSPSGTLGIVSEPERLRNLAWEVGVSAELKAVHVRALASLARLFEQRCARVKRTARSGCTESAVTGIG